MGLDAQVIAIGPFSTGILPALEYGPEFYADVITGATVVSNVFLADTSEDSHKLAAAFGVGAMELGQHELLPGRAKHDLLSEVFGEKNVAHFILLAQAGFRFYYLPNG